MKIDHDFSYFLSSLCVFYLLSMRNFCTLLTVYVFNSLIVSAQKRTIQGRIISHELASLSHVYIFQNDTIELGRTDQYGKFTIDISSDVIRLASVGFETAVIGLKPGCDYVELVLMPNWHIDFASSTQVDKFRRKEFDKIPELHSLAYANGIFRKKEVCYTREFRPEKRALDSINKVIKAPYVELKQAFRNVKAGDTLQIPFRKSRNYDSEKRTVLSGYSTYGSLPEDYCSVYGVVLSKNRRKGALNLEYRVVNVGTCGGGCIYGDKVMQEGEQFVLDSKYYKLVGL
jgi:hypothetical protein